MRFQCKSQWRWLIALTLVLLLFAAGCGSPSTLATSSDPVSQNQSVNNSPTQPQQASPTAVDTIPVKVTRVVDGDTIEIVLNGKTEKVRLIGVDTPETVHPTQAEEPYGREASNFTKAQLDGMQVNLEFDVEERDKYGRLLAYVWLSDRLFNEVLVSEGYAQVATYPPNVKYVDRFTAAQAEAREANRGLWGLNLEMSDVKPVTPTTPSTVTKGTFVGSTNSDKYHYPTCQWAQKISPQNEVWFSSSEDAYKTGYVPCKVCGPPLPASASAPSQTSVSPSPSPAPAASSDVTVYITNTGSKYHRDGCQYLAKSKIAISLSNAKSRGYGPCSKCGPPR